MHFIVLMMSIFLLIGIIRGILRIKDTKTSLKNYTDKLKGNIVREFSDIDIIIPVYNEQKIIKQSINNFLPLIEKGVRVTYVTTQKEESSPTTKELLRKYIAEYHLVGTVSYTHLDVYKRQEPKSWNRHKKQAHIVNQLKGYSHLSREAHLHINKQTGGCI